jgi:hypothetical protein
MTMIVVDVWGGKNSMEHVARFMRGEAEALELARRELRAGFLVNLRFEVAFGPEQDFDSRRIN